jgi:hypothetical protein
VTGSAGIGARAQTCIEPIIAPYETTPFVLIILYCMSVVNTEFENPRICKTLDLKFRTTKKTQ